MIREDAIRAAGAALALVLSELDALSPRQAAERAVASNGGSVDDVEDAIRADRGLRPLRRAVA